MALDEHIVEIARLMGGELAQAEVVEEEQVRREPAPQFPIEGVIGPGLSHTICSKVAVSSKAACSSRRVRPWLSRRSISSWSKSSRNSTWLSFPWRAWVTRSGSVGSRPPRPSRSAMVVGVDEAAIAPPLERLADVARRHGV